MQRPSKISDGDLPGGHTASLVDRRGYTAAREKDFDGSNLLERPLMRVPWVAARHRIPTWLPQTSTVYSGLKSVSPSRFVAIHRKA